MSEENKKSENALREEKILEFWREQNIFNKTLEQSKGRKEFVFYEGPPTANGKPGIHHLEARAFKDAIPRYKTMRGYHVRRKGGWDTHGLPVELQVEKALGLNSKKAIEEYGIAEFNKKCKESVWEYTDLWEKFTDRIGYWVDQKNPYVTYDNNYIESVWNVVKKVEEQGLLYKDYKVVPWCPRCGTALSSHELAQGYEDVKDISIYAKFKIKGVQNVYFVAWTTTPWTLPGNVALAVGTDIDYVEVKVGEEILVVAKNRLGVLGEGYEIVAEHKGSEMVGMEYEPLFPYIQNAKPEKLENAYKVYSADFVTTEDGTGIVHTAVMYGADDFDLGTKVGLPKYHLVGLDGKFIDGTDFLTGRFVKEKSEDGKPTLDVDIIKYLQDKNLFFKKELYEHSYPHCWRCKTALIYYARDSWYIRMTDPKIKDKLISENKKINWEPEHTREGRFGEWLSGIKDWAISRERYWGTPLPVWISNDGEKIVLDSINTIHKYAKKSGNSYFVMRHGQAESNKKGVWDSSLDSVVHLTEEGEAQVREAAAKFKKQKIDLIIRSPLLRIQETVDIFKESTGYKGEILVDDRLREFNPGDAYQGKPLSSFLGKFSKYSERYTTPNPEGETYRDLRKRVMQALYEYEKKYQGKNILIASHGGPILNMILGAHGIEESKVPEDVEEYHYPKNGEIKEIHFIPLPHNDRYELDLHRPFIDDIVLEKDGKDFYRVKEVMDVWFDSGAMPFAQDHYPFENKGKSFLAKIFGQDKLAYPADFISEAIDQTRGWFYTLHAVGVLMGRGLAYKNVICLGHILDEKGKKMSKSLGNIVDPWMMMDKYGVDTLRLFMYSVNQPGESKNFDEKTVKLMNQQYFGLLYNVLAFYELYRDKDLESSQGHPLVKNVLDLWILARLNETIKISTENIDAYNLIVPVRTIKDFIDDLSTWYLRRSRERIKEGDKEAKQTLYFVLKTLAKLLAPFAPFSAEDIWQRLKNEGDVESVHLTEWPEGGKVSPDIIENMKILREIVSLGLKERQVKNVPVRQPLASITLKEKLESEYEEILKDELNVKEVRYHAHEENIILDFNITPELKTEGQYRELLRAVQEKRKEMGLQPSDSVVLVLPEDAKELAQKYEAEFKKTAGLSDIKFEAGTEMRLEK